ncbi:MAG: hypothetical protein FJ276_35410 [Planctomycetes bacterium]|nr:hypothetical protein [Planctomycetota bacterium]
MAEPGLIDDEAVEIELIGSSCTEVAGELVRRAFEIHIIEGREDRLPWLLTHPSLTRGVMTQILAANPAMLRDLGHQSGPRKLLDFLAEEHRYPEAVLTIAKDLYTSPDASTADFRAFLANHADDEWMLKSLAHLAASAPEKEQELIAVLQDHAGAYDYFIGIRRGQQREKRALEATSETTMRELFETGDPAALRGLARNPLTPELMLRDLVRTEGIKGAREIRRLASQSLRRVSKAS